MSRWGLCALLFFATTLNYLDRQTLGILAPYLQNALFYRTMHGPRWATCS